MYQAFYRGSEFLHLPLLTLLLFLGIFVGVLTWLYVLRRKDPRFDELANLPLRDDEPAPGGDGVRHG